jgi:hypothetical protein
MQRTRSLSPSRSKRKARGSRKEKEKERTNSPRILDFGLPFSRSDTNVVRFDRVARRRDQEVGEEGADRVAVAGQSGHGDGSCACGSWRGRERGGDVRG